MKKWIAIVLATGVAGCSSAPGGRSFTNPPVQMAAAAGTSSASIHITIPNGTSASSSSSARRPQFVSAAVAGVSLQFFLHSDSRHTTVVGGGTFDVASTSGLCTPSTGLRSCTLIASTQSGTEDIVVTTYDAAPAAGSFAGAHQLGIGTVYSVAMTTAGPNTYNVAIGGTIASIVLSPPTTLGGSSAGSYALGYTAYDADGEAIIAGGNSVTNGAGNTETDTYSNPMTLTLSETGGSGHTKLSLNGGVATNSIVVTTSSATVTVSYDGLATNGYSATFTATADGATNDVAELPLNFGGPIYVANYNNSDNSHDIDVYPPNPTGLLNESPAATIMGVGFPNDVGLDSSGKIYVVNNGLTKSIDVYPASPSGTVNEAPLARITGSNTQLDQPNNIAFDSTGKVYILNAGASNSITVYAANPSGTLNETPLATIAGSNTQLNQPLNVALDAAGRIYVTNGGTLAVTVYAANPSGTLNEAPIATIAGNNTLLTNPYGIKIDPAGRVVVADETSNSILVFPANPVGVLNEAPVAVIGGGSSDLFGPQYLAIDSTGKIYAVNLGTGTGSFVTVYAANPVGMVTGFPLATLKGSNTNFGVAAGIAVH